MRDVIDSITLSGGGKGKEIVLDYRLLRKSVLTLRALNHKIRKGILEILQDGKPTTVTEIFTKLNVEQSIASQHIAILRRAGLVDFKRESKFIYYTLNKERLGEIERLIDKIIGNSVIASPAFSAGRSNPV